ncbi:MAG: ABC transporter ATP-binding protein [Promethearchaeota archaeon]|nr:MAG: ABC transporter ATP-binding protein [Candidatus Lokiarchaeota archaeon]
MQIINGDSITETVLKLNELSHYYGDLKAVDEISLEVQKGEIIGLVGPNGAGKTTTIKMIAHILRPDNGEILIRNKHGELQNLFKNPRNLIQRGFLIDIPEFYKMTPYQLLKYFAKLANYPKEKIDERIDELLKMFNLFEWKYKTVDKFSKGMKQKLGLIQAVIHDPEIIILDEPQTGLDPKARIEVRAFIKDMKSQGKTIFVASHLLHEISEVCDKVALLNRGQVIAFDTIENLETNLKTNELIVQILESLDSEKIEPIIKQLIQNLDPYLAKDVDPNIAPRPVKYDPISKEFILYYDGKKRSRAEILKILFSQFNSEFTISLFSQPKSSQLERIYEELIKDKTPISQKNSVKRGVI